MPKETAEGKARRLLAEGAVHVHTADENRVTARVRGASGVYDVTWLGGRWSCTCAAYGRCSHVKAVRLCTMGQRVTASA